MRGVNHDLDHNGHGGNDNERTKGGFDSWQERILVDRFLFPNEDKGKSREKENKTRIKDGKGKV